MNINLTPIFQALIALLAALITYKVIPWIKSKTTQSQRADLVAAAKIAVYAAEQIYGRDKEANDKKLEYAIDRLRDAGFDLDGLALREAIEAAVYDIKGKALPRFIDFWGDMNESEKPEQVDADNGGDAGEDEAPADEPDEDVDGD